MQHCFKFMFSGCPSVRPYGNLVTREISRTRGGFSSNLAQGCTMRSRWSDYATFTLCSRRPRQPRFARNVVGRGILVIFAPYSSFVRSCYKVFSRSITVSVTGRGEKGLLSPGGSKAHYGSAPAGLPRMPVRSLPACHVLLGSFTFLTFWSRSDTFFTFCQGFLRMKPGRRAALEHVCAHGMKRRPPKQDSAGGSQWRAPSHPPKCWWQPWGLPSS